MVKLDVLIIGVGTAGEDAAGAFLAKGRSTGLVERGRPGGDCIFHACIPTKHRFSNLFNRHRNITSSCTAYYLNLSASGAPSRPGRAIGSLFQEAFRKTGLWALPG